MKTVYYVPNAHPDTTEIVQEKRPKRVAPQISETPPKGDNWDTLLREFSLPMSNSEFSQSEAERHRNRDRPGGPSAQDFQRSTSRNSISGITREISEDHWENLRSALSLTKDKENHTDKTKSPEASTKPPQPEAPAPPPPPRKEEREEYSTSAVEPVLSPPASSPPKGEEFSPLAASATPPPERAEQESTRVFPHEESTRKSTPFASESSKDPRRELKKPIRADTPPKRKTFQKLNTVPRSLSGSKEETRSFKVLKALSDEKKAKTSRREKIEINKVIKKLKTGNLNVAHNGAFIDLSVCEIGSMKVAEAPLSTKNAIQVGNDELIENLILDFAPLRGCEEPGNYTLRVGVTLKEKGQAKAERYVKRLLKKQEKKKWKERRKKGNRRITSKECRTDIKTLMSHRRTYSIDTSEGPLHINLRGKLEMFIPVKTEEMNLVEAPPKEHKTQSKIFSRYTRFARSKVWIQETSEHINKKIAGAVQTLADGIREVLG